MRLLNDSLVHGLEHGHDTQVSHTNSHATLTRSERMRCVNDIDSQDCTPARDYHKLAARSAKHTQAKAVHQRKTTFLRRASARHTGVDGANIASALWLVRAIASVLWPGRAFASDLWLGRAYQRCLALSPYLQAPPNFGEAPTLCGTNWH